VTILKQIALGDQELAIQRQAVFALSRLKHGDGVKELIEIAKNHKVPEIRRQAIFWLGRSEDDRAIDFLVELVRRK
jgi:HEAT repeat protein